MTATRITAFDLSGSTEMTQEAGSNAPACRGCRFYEEISSAHGSFGKCRRLSPRWRGVPQHMDDDRATWPEVDGDDWCGEFEAIPVPHEHEWVTKNGVTWCLPCGLIRDDDAVPELRQGEPK